MTDVALSIVLVLCGVIAVLTKGIHWMLDPCHPSRIAFMRDLFWGKKKVVDSPGLLIEFNEPPARPLILMVRHPSSHWDIPVELKPNLDRDTVN